MLTAPQNKLEVPSVRMHSYGLGSEGFQIGQNVYPLLFIWAVSRTY